MTILKPRPRPPRNNCSSFLYYSTSNAWPGPTRFATYFVVCSAVLAVVQFALSTYIGVLLLRMPKQVRCYDWYKGWVVMDRPVTFWNVERYQDWDRDRRWGAQEDAVSVAQVGGKGFITWSCIISPTLLLLLSIWHLVQHTRPKAISNRGGIAFSIWLILTWLLVMIADCYMQVDRDRIVMEWPLCRQFTAQMDGVQAESSHRKRSLLALRAVVIVAVICMITYLALALHAIYLTKKHAERRVIRTTSTNRCRFPRPIRLAALRRQAQARAARPTISVPYTDIPPMPLFTPPSSPPRKPPHPPISKSLPIITTTLAPLPAMHTDRRTQDVPNEKADGAALSYTDLETERLGRDAEKKKKRSFQVYEDPFKDPENPFREGDTPPGDLGVQRKR